MTADAPVVDSAALLVWGQERLRDLPWRRTRDPWSILVSEVMLQQTQVSRVVEKWPAFLADFPTPAACAAAPLGTVLRAWQGLGYPRRAAALHRAASDIASAGGMPSTLDGLLRLPGVGPYTARAVLAFAFESDAAVVDTNVARVLARLAGRPLGARDAQRAADGLLVPGRAWWWNQSMMELGATVCTARSAVCETCPLREDCAWRGIGADPARGSAFVSRPQGRFDGSDRQARGALLRRLGDGAVRRTDAAAVMLRADPVAERIVVALIADGLCVEDGGLLRLP